MFTVVTGPPCGGKTTYVAEHREPTDLVVDLDAIAHALGYPDEQIEWGSTHPAVAAARLARTQILRALLDGRLRTTAWVIDTKPDRGMQAQYRRAGGRIVIVDPGRAMCLERAAERGGDQVIAGVNDWYGHAGTGHVPALDIFR